MMSDLEIEPFELDITEDVKNLFDEHTRLAEQYRKAANSFEEDAADARRRGSLDEYEAARDEAGYQHEAADLHEHTANVLGIILGAGEEAAA